jgi:hypothetical protein
MNYVEYTFYYGAFPFLLSLLAPLRCRERKTAWLWSATLGLTVLTAVGSPLVHLARWIPGMTYFTLHRVMSHVPFLGSWLAAMTFDSIADREGQPMHWPSLIVVVVAVSFGTVTLLHACRLEAGPHWAAIGWELIRRGSVVVLGVAALIITTARRRTGLILAVLVSFVDLFWWGSSFNPVSSLELLYPRNDVTRWLKQDASLYRVLPLQRGRRIFGENVLSVFHIGTPDGYLSLTLRRHKELMYAIDPYYDVAPCFQGPHINTVVSQDFHPAHSLLNAKYVLSSTPLENPRLLHRATLEGVHVYENREALPRAYVVHRARLPTGEDDWWDLLTSSDWEYGDEVLLSEALEHQQAAMLDRTGDCDACQVAIERYGTNQVRLRAKLERAGLLILADPFCRGWRASVDGQPTRIVRVNHAQRAIFLAPGEHTVAFRFVPQTVLLGVVIAFASCAIGGTVVVIASRHSSGPECNEHDRSGRLRQ